MAKRRFWQKVNKIYRLNKKLLEREYVCPYTLFGKVGEHWDKLESCMTPIERNVWADIRFLGLPFYPQYPIANYRVDFASPMNKLVIEVDGREYHSSFEHIERDIKRQKKIESLGWKVMRIAGWQTFVDPTEGYVEDYEDCEEIEYVGKRGDLSSERIIAKYISDKYGSLHNFRYPFPNETRDSDRDKKGGGFGIEVARDIIKLARLGLKEY